MLTDWENWACAALVEQKHGSDGPKYIAERIGALAASNEAAGVAAWKAIAAWYQQLLRDSVTAATD